jgi:hypothetical protein
MIMHPTGKMDIEPRGFWASSVVLLVWTPSYRYPSAIVLVKNATLVVPLSLSNMSLRDITRLHVMISEGAYTAKWDGDAITVKMRARIP